MQSVDSTLTHQQLGTTEEAGTTQEAEGPCLVIVSRPDQDRDHHAFHRMADAVAYLERLQNNVPPIPAQVFTMHEVNDIDLR